VKFKGCVIDSIQSHFDSHIIDLHSFQNIEVLISDGHQEGVDSLMLALDVGLRENKGVVGMDSSVGDPVFLGEDGGAVDDKLFCFVVIGGSCLHLNRVVAVAQLSQTETSCDFKRVD
jgi:hypothetical protein